jgi:hypothetical protein
MSLMGQWVIWMVRTALRSAANGSSTISSTVAELQQQLQMPSFSQAAYWFCRWHMGAAVEFQLSCCSSQAADALCWACGRCTNFSPQSALLLLCLSACS